MDKKEAIKLDYRIAVEVMGLHVVEDPVCHRGFSIDSADRHGADLPSFSTDIWEAMKVWDKLRQKGHRWLLNVDDGGFHLRHVACITHHGDVDEKDYRVDRPLGMAKKIEDLPRVICEVALSETNAIKVS